MKWTWTWANSRRWSKTGRPGRLQSMGSQRVRHDWITEQQQGYLGHRVSHRTSCHQEKSSEIFLWNKHCILFQIYQLPKFSAVQFTVQFSSVQSLSCVRLFAIPLTAACQASLSITNSQSLSKLMSIGISDAIQPSYPLLTPSPPSFNLSQDQGLFKWVSFSHQVAKILEFQLQHQFFQWTPRFPLGWTGWISLQSKGLSRVFSNTTVQKHQFFSTQLSIYSNSNIHTWLLEKP